MTLVEIEKSSIILPAMVYRTPIWCFTVYEIGKCEFDWMGEGSLGRDVVNVGGIIIKDYNYIKVSTTNPMALQQKQFCQIENTVYVRTENDDPLWVYYNPKYNAILGFTDEKSCELNGVVYKSGLDYIPTVSDEADMCGSRLVIIVTSAKDYSRSLRRSFARIGCGLCRGRFLRASQEYRSCTFFRLRGEK